jgi:lipopolysaccharide/colanic/teichoic acid biosynthesis glycosyltransferase
MTSYGTNTKRYPFRMSYYADTSQKPEKMARRIKLDRHYIDNWSPLLDFKILGMTLVAVLRQRNAH